ncbi:MAG: PhzF family phenazine biosynthesis protein [Verrucomicrobiota bacterium]|nr:PhzF family phenazine biosynthesis protein [Verrucomicrobiota bacterium]
MPTIPYFEVLAFTDKFFAGNPAGVCVLESDWLPVAQMQQIAHENNLAETAFVIEREGALHLRWFTPTMEIELCGHARLATAHALFHHRGRAGDELCFQSQSGELKVTRKGDLLELDFPSRPAKPTEFSGELTNALGAKPSELLVGRDYLAIFKSEAEVAALKPNSAAIKALPVHGVIVSAMGDACDFVSRYFAPAVGIEEDPVTGSAHCTLIPYWSKRLGKNTLRARQISPRRGDLICEDRGARVGIGGHALTYLEGKIYLP